MERSWPKTWLLLHNKLHCHCGRQRTLPASRLLPLAKRSEKTILTVIVCKREREREREAQYCYILEISTIYFNKYMTTTIPNVNYRSKGRSTVGTEICVTGGGTGAGVPLTRRWRLRDTLVYLPLTRRWCLPPSQLGMVLARPTSTTSTTTTIWLISL